MTKSDVQESLVLPDGGQRTRILSFDGGPSGEVTLRLLRRYEQEHPGFVESVDMFVGVSFGGFVASSLAHELSKTGTTGLQAIDRTIALTNRIVELFRLSPRMLLRLLGNRSMIEGDALRRVLENHFGDQTLGGLKKPVTLVAFDATAWNLATYHPFEPDGSPDMSLVDAALASAAFPVVLPVFRSPKDHRRRNHVIIDGGFINNSAILAAVSDIMSRDTCHEVKPKDPETIALPSITLLSMGMRRTRRDPYMKLLRRLFPPRPDRVSYDYGWLWLLSVAPRVPFSVIEGAAEMDSRIMRQLLGERYYRFEPGIDAAGLVEHELTSTELGDRDMDDMARTVWAQGTDIHALTEWISRCWNTPSSAHSPQGIPKQRIGEARS